MQLPAIHLRTFGPIEHRRVGSDAGPARAIHPYLSAPALLSLVLVVGCRDAAPPGRTTATGNEAARADASVAAPTVVPMPTIAPGSWPHVEYSSPCVVRLTKAPEADIDLLKAAARKRLAVLGGSAKLETTSLGDRLLRADFDGATAPARPPRTRQEAGVLAKGYLQSVADVFGVTLDEISRIEIVQMVPVSGVPGVRWELFGSVERSPRLDVMPVRSGRAHVVVDLDRRGAPVTLKVDWELLPPVTLCNATLDRAALERAVVGRALSWDGWEGHHDEGAIVASDIQQIEHGIQRLHGSGLDAAVTIGVVHTVFLLRNHKPWALDVDPSTGGVVAVRQQFMQ